QIPDAGRGHRMNTLASLPVWLALPIALLVLASAVITLIGSLGLVRFKGFYQRLHAPPLGTTLGLYLMVAAAVIFFPWSGGHPAIHVILIGLMLTFTTPVTLLLLTRAALARDHRAGTTGVPEVHDEATGSSRTDKL